MSFAVLFSGQGGHNPSMFRLFTENRELMKYLEEACAFTGIRLSETEGLLKEKILPNKYAQPLICAFCYGIWQGLKNSLPEASCFAGFSLGELTAYACAGSFDFSTLLRLSGLRAKFMDEALSDDISVCAVKGIAIKQLENECEAAGTYMMIISGHAHATVGGTRANMDEFRLNAGRTRGAEIIEIPLKVPSHTPLMKQASEKFAGVLREIDFATPSIPVIAGIDGALIRNAKAATAALSEQICRTVRWDVCMECLRERRIRVFLETGPGRTLGHIAEENFPGIPARSVDDFKTLSGISAWLRKHDIE